MINIRPKIRGTGRIAHRCYLCQRLIQSGDAVFMHRNGLLVAAHSDCQLARDTDHGR